MSGNDPLISWLLILTVPFIFALMYVWLLKWTGKKRKALRGTVYMSTPFLIFAVRELTDLLVGGDNTGWVIVILLVLIGISLYIQYKTAGEMKLRKTLTSFLRITFFVFAILYVMLCIIAVVTGVMNV